MRKKRSKAGTSKSASAVRKARFIEAYLANGENGDAAAVTAGFSPKTAGSQASRLLKDVRVQSVIEKRRNELLHKFELTTEGVLRELARITYFDVGKCFDEEGNLRAAADIDEDTRRALASIKDGEVKAFSKTEAISKAMAYLRLLPGHNINVNATAQSLAAAEVNQTAPEQRSLLDIARRIAFTLSMGAEEASKAPVVEKSAQA